MQKIIMKKVCSEKSGFQIENIMEIQLKHAIILIMLFVVGGGTQWASENFYFNGF